MISFLVYCFSKRVAMIHSRGFERSALKLGDVFEIAGEQQLGQLLGDGTSRPFAHFGNHTDSLAEIDAGMLTVARVLGRNQCVNQVQGKFSNLMSSGSLCNNDR